MSSVPPPPPLPAAGWFPDPWTAGTLRYWDGAAWTGWIAPGPSDQGASPTLPLRAGLVGLAVLLGGFVVGIAVSIPLYLLDAPDALLVLAAGLGVYAPVAWYCCWVSRHDGTGDLGRDLGFRWKPIDLATGLGAWLAATVLQVAVLVVLQVLGLPIGTNTDTISDARDTPATLVALALLAVLVAPVVEELLFRGLLLRSLRSRLGPWPAILVQGALFGAIHVQLGVGLENLTVIATLTAVGIVFGFVADQVGRIGPAIVGHAIFNGVAVAAVIVTG
jgi:membrane protease YdiL (CAAX protease family)